MEKRGKDPYGGSRSWVQVVCAWCKKDFWKPKRFIHRGRPDFCSRDCGHKGQRDRVLLHCAACGIDFERSKSRLGNSKSGLFFCSRKCKDGAQRIGGIQAIQPDHYGTITSPKAYRRKALRSKAEVCERCGFKRVTAILIVHHKDRDRTNFDLNNLEVLCPNCHMEEHLKRVRSRRGEALGLQPSQGGSTPPGSTTKGL